MTAHLHSLAPPVRAGVQQVQVSSPISQNWEVRNLSKEKRSATLNLIQTYIP
jgi:hypothetical protein